MIGYRYPPCEIYQDVLDLFTNLLRLLSITLRILFFFRYRLLCSVL